MRFFGFLYLSLSLSFFLYPFINNKSKILLKKYSLDDPLFFVNTWVKQMKHRSKRPKQQQNL